MKVDRVQAYLLSFPLPDPIRLPFHGGEQTIVKRDAMLIRVDASNGLTGYAPGPASESARDAIQNFIGPFLKVRALADPDALRVQFELQMAQTPDREVARTYGAIEIALWDLVAKKHAVPLSEVAGGRVRDRIALYGSTRMYHAPEAYAAEAAAIAAQGFRAYKMPLAGGPEEDVTAVRLMREAVAINLLIDAHGWWSMGERNYTLETVERVAEQMAEFDPLWLQEPLPPGDPASYVALKEKDLIPLASGAHERDEESFFDLIQTNAVDYLQMDVSRQGGIAMARRLLGAATRQGLRFSFNCWSTELDVLAAAHLGICWEETVVEWLEYPWLPAPQILKAPLQIERGELVVPRGPGLGIEMDEEAIDKYPWIPGPSQTLTMAGDR
jgi:L-alanine-DL-glutamate epimerase-like enolase superfamily enzyme